MSDAATELTAHLDADERILWTGVPVRGIIFRAEDKFLIPFGLFWLAFVLIWEAGALGTAANKGGPALFFVLWGLPFIAVGLYMTVGRFVWDADVRGKTAYAITTRRAIIARRVPTRQFRSIGITSATEISTVERSDGSGTIYFGPRLVGYAWGGWPGAGQDVFTFERIRNVREAMRVVRTIQRGAK